MGTRDYRALRALIEESPVRRSSARAFARRLSVVLSLFYAVRQLAVNRQLLEAIDRLDSNTVRPEGLEEARVWLHNMDRTVRTLEHRLDPIERFVSASRSHAAPASLGLEEFDCGETGRVLGYRKAGRAVAADDAYVAFEDVFRLSEDVIRERQRPYVALVSGRRPVIDIGCGRGEFLELLREAGVPAFGADMDPGMVARARSKGLDVRQEDGLETLASQDDGSVGAVFAAQLIEHLPYERVITFLRLSLQKLAPGGMLILETVNPHAPGALKNFWFDLTHQHPVFPEVLLTLCRAAGFGSAYVFHPGGTGSYEEDRERIPDYALVAEPAPAG